MKRANNEIKGDEKMKAAIAGGTGFLGTMLVERLIESGFEVFILTRNPVKYKKKKNVTYVKWLSENAKPEEVLNNVEVFINLAGESINNGRWSSKQKQTIIDSRMQTTKEVLRILTAVETKTKVLIQASAVGYYESSETKTYTEKMQDSGNDFLAKTVTRWEAEANLATELGIRTVLCRFGIILGKKDGALPLIALPYKLFVGGTVGSGNQWLSWIHVLDVTRAILFIIKREEISGPVNVTAPQPTTMKQFGKTLSTVLRRPHWLPVPDLLMKIALGEKSTLVLHGQKVLPAQLMENGFTFTYPELHEALSAIYHR